MWRLACDDWLAAAAAAAAEVLAAGRVKATADAADGRTEDEAGRRTAGGR